jgi:hypothetical protein
MASAEQIPSFEEFERVMASLSTKEKLRFTNEHAQQALEDGLDDDISTDGASVGSELTQTLTLTKGKIKGDQFSRLTLTNKP